MLDHIGFGVTNLEAFCKRLTSMGIKFEDPLNTPNSDGFASARFTPILGALVWS
jgi:hypothetical protein